MQFEALHPSRRIVLIMQRIYNYNMTTTSGGNLSIRDGNGDIWITPSGVDKGSLTEEDICCVKPDGTILGKHKPSVEYPFHRSIYESRKDINAVLHAHPPALVAFSMVRKLPETAMLPAFHKICGQVEIAPYGLPGSSDLGRKISEVIDRGINTVLLENHGTVVVAEDLFKAFMIFETFDYCARLEILARGIGKPVLLSPEQLSADHCLPFQGEEYEPETRDNQEEAARREMCEMIHRAYDQGLIMSTQGTFSKRLDGNAFLIMPHNMDRRLVAPEDLVRIDRGRREAGKTPSLNTLTHQRIYEKNPWIQAVITAQPSNLMAYTVTGKDFDSKTIPESYIVLRQVLKVPYETDAAQLSGLFSSRHPVILVQNHCVVVAGSSLLNAFDRLEVGEYSAKALIAAKNLGEVVMIDHGQIRDIEQAFGLD